MTKCKTGVLLLIFLSAIYSCGNDPQSGQSFDIAESSWAFNDFPDSLYYGIYFSQPTILAGEHLKNKGFELIDSSGSWRYFRPDDSTEVIFPTDQKIRAVKIILRPEEQEKEVKWLQRLFENNSSAQEATNSFYAYSFKSGNNETGGSVTMYVQKEFIRLYFEAKTSR